MTKGNTRSNPFYVLLVIVGVAFVVSACAYGVMAYREVTLQPAANDDSASGLLRFMDRHGMKVLGGEVVMLGLLTVAAIGTDEYWQRKTEERES